MIAGVLGIAGLVLALFAAGAFMEGDTGQMWKFAAAFGVCGVLIVLIGAPGPTVNFSDCHVDWDGRSNPTVCD